MYTAIIGRVAVGKMIRYRTTCACALLVYYVVSCKHSLYLLVISSTLRDKKKVILFSFFQFEEDGRSASVVGGCVTAAAADRGDAVHCYIYIALYAHLGTFCRVNTFS